MKRLIPVVLAALLLAPPVTAAGHSLTIECADPSGATTTLCDVYLNPDVHNGSLGTLLFHATTAGKRTITVPDGRIAIRASARVSSGTNTSVLVVTLPSPCKPGWAQLGYQSWWSDTGQDPAFGSRHSHIDDLCVPANNLIVNGPQTFAFTLRLHKQPTGARLTRVRVKDYCSGSGCAMGGKSSGSDVWVSRTDLPQPVAGSLSYAVSVPLDLSKMKTGRHELRFGVYVTQPNGKVQLLSSRTEVCVNGGCAPSYRSLSTFPLLQGNGSWYDNDTIGYIDARIRSTIP